MNTIIENPYRILGLFGNASEKDLQRQLSKLKAYTIVKKTINLEYDFGFLEEINRTEESILGASRKIEQSKDKITNALFWFININAVDKLAFEYLRNNEIQEAINIWNQLVENNSLNINNYSAAINLSTLQLSLLLENKVFNADKFQKSIYLKGVIISSDTFQEFIHSVTGTASLNNNEAVAKNFIDESISSIKMYIGKSGGISITQLIQSFNSFPNEAKQYLVAKYTAKPILNIEALIDETCQKRKATPSDSEQYGEELYLKTKEDIQLLRNILGGNNVQYQVIVNKVSNEILQCAIDFYNEYFETDNYDPGDESLRLTKMAKSLKPSGMIINRINENLEQFQEWIDGKFKRDKYKRSKPNLDAIKRQLEIFQHDYASIETSEKLIIDCKAHLFLLKSSLGDKDELYLNVCSTIVNNAMGMIIDIVNEKQSSIESDRSNILYLPDIISSSLEVIDLINTLDMDYETRSRLIKNQQGLKETNLFLNERLSNISNESKQTYKAEGCYVATMAYGSYDHPNTMALRQFRDNFLCKNSLGRSFIKLYYRYSPSLVNLLRNKKLCNSLIRFLLNNILRILK